MDKHTKKGLKPNWSQQAAKSRANRKASSAPTEPELKNYQELLFKVLDGNGSPKILVLGSTPELRDLAISLGATTTAVDISQDMLDQMTAVMKFKDSPKNLFKQSDWLELDKTFKPESFDVVLADASLNNVPPQSHDQVLKNLHSLLKPGGFFISRNYVYLPNKPIDTIEQVQEKYNQGRLDWLWLTIHSGQYTEWKENIYRPETKEFAFGKLLDLFFNLIEQGKFKMTADDLKKLSNVRFHAHKVIHISFPESEWNDLVKKYFNILGRVSVDGLEWTEFGPIWFLKKK